MGSKRGPKDRRSNAGLAPRHFGPANPPPVFDEENMKEKNYNGTKRLIGELKPMLAEVCYSVDKVKYPVLATPKIDGIRCLTGVDGVPMSRSLKPIPNRYIREQIQSWGMEGCDGELWIPGAETFGEVSSAVMKEDGEPDFQYLVFDIWDRADMGYDKRVILMAHRLRPPRPPWVKLVIPELCFDAGGLMKFWSAQADLGYEGVIFRNPDGLYKFGRSIRGMMMKLKLFEDDEAEIIGFEELMTNTNPPKKNALGRTERSSAKAGKVPAGKLGKFVCRDLKTNIEFEIGTGFTDAQRKQFWRDRQVYVGWILKYRHQPSGRKAKPRFPSFLGFRSKDDM